MKNASTFNVVFVGGAVVGELLTAKDEALLLGIDAGLFLDSLLDSPDGVGRVDINLGLIARKQLDLDEHGWLELGRGGREAGGLGGGGGARRALRRCGHAMWWWTCYG